MKQMEESYENSFSNHWLKQAKVFIPFSPFHLSGAANESAESNSIGNASLPNRDIQIKAKEASVVPILNERSDHGSVRLN